MSCHTNKRNVEEGGCSAVEKKKKQGKMGSMEKKVKFSHTRGKRENMVQSKNEGETAKKMVP